MECMQRNRCTVQQLVQKLVQKEFSLVESQVGIVEEGSYPRKLTVDIAIFVNSRWKGW
jgi:hypothetical protein